MQLFLGYESAIEYWRAVGSGIAPMPRRSNVRSVAQEITACKDILDAAPQISIANRSTVHALVSRKSRTYAAEGVIYHVVTRELPEGSFFCTSNNVMVASPALCLLQAARQSKESELLPLVELCYEFLGGYSLCDGAKRGFRTHDPFLEKADLESFLSQLPKRTRGIRMLERALAFVLPNSRSPRETEAALMITLPESLGGFAFPTPTLNHRVEILGPFTKLTDKTRFYLDLFWDEQHTAFEYDGSDHNEPTQIADDKARRSLLAAMGYKLIVAEKAQVDDVRLFNQIIGQLAYLLGINVPIPPRDIADKRTKLRAYLFNPQHHQSCSYTRPIALIPSAELS